MSMREPIPLKVTTPHLKVAKFYSRESPAIQTSVK